MSKQSVCVCGLGYIGLPTASLLASKGYKVLGVDVKSDVVDTINAGKIHISEPELDVLVRSAVQSGNLKAAAEPAASDVFIIAVPTPFKKGHVPDLSYVEAATRAIAPYLEVGNLLILESTCPVGSTERVAEWVLEERSDLAEGQIKVAHCPERVLPGQIIRELVSNDRIVGGTDESSTELAAEFYRSFVSGEILMTRSRTAELAKLTENTFRDVNIALANELSVICDELDVDVWELIGLANHHPRVNVLQPGPGVGGHCIAVDPWFIVDSSPDSSRLIRAARQVNQQKPKYVVRQVLEALATIPNPVIACFGLAYKPDIDDLRESPAVSIVREIAERTSAKLLVVEPNIRELPDQLHIQNVSLVGIEEALNEAKFLLGLVGHTPFKSISVSKLDNVPSLDTCGMWRSR